MLQRDNQPVMIQNQYLQTTIQQPQPIIPTLRDKQKLFSKLFINSTYLPIQGQGQLIVQPTFINLIIRQLQQLKHNKLNKQQLQQYKRSILKQLLDIIKQKQQNMILIYNHDRDQQQTILNTIVMEIINLIDTQQHVQLFATYLQSLTSYYFIKMRNMNKLTQYLSKTFYKQKFNSLKLKFILKVIHQYYKSFTYEEISSSKKHIPSLQLKTKRQVQKTKRQVLKVSFFYLYGQTSMGIRTILKPINQHFQQPIKNEFSFVICFKLTQPQVFNRQKPLGLLRFKTNKQQITVQIINHKIIIVNQLNDKTVSCMSEIHCDKMYRLVINFTYTSTQLSINKQIHTLQPVIKKHSQERQFDSVVFGQGFQGILFSLLMLNKKLQVQRQFPYEMYPLGIERWSTLNKLKGKNNNKFLQKVVLGYLPFSMFENRYKMYCFDIFRKIHGQLLDNVIVMNESKQYSNCSNITLGGIQSILPLFYLARFYQYRKYPQLLDELLQLLLTIVHNSNIMVYKYSQQLASSISSANTSTTNISDTLSQQFNKDTFIILGNLFANLSLFYTTQTFHILLNLFFKLNDQQKLHFINHFLWNISIAFVQNQQIIKSFYLLVIKIYQNNKSIILKSKTITDIVYWAVHHFEKRKLLKNNFSCQQQENDLKKKILLQNIIDLQQRDDKRHQKKLLSNHHSQTVFYCCLQHYLNQSVLYRDFNIKTAQTMTLKSHHLHYSWLQKILSILLQYHFILNLSQAQQSIKVLLRFLMKKYSTCFYLFIIKAIKRQLKTMFSSTRNIDTNRQFIQALHQKHNILTYLQFLSQKTISLDLITEIIQFHLFFYQAPHLNQHDKQQILQFISNTIKRLTDVYNCMNPVKIGVKKIRKLSDQLYEKNNVHDIKTSTKESTKLKQSLSILNNFLTINNKRRKQVLESKPMSFGGYEPLFYLIQNYLTGQISQQLIADNLSIKFKSQEAFLLFKIYYQSLPKKSIFKLKLLRCIQKYINSSQANKVFLMKNVHFLQAIISQLTLIKNISHKQTYQNEIRQCIQRIMIEFFQSFLKNNQQQQYQFQIGFRSFYKILKNASKDFVEHKGLLMEQQQQQVTNAFKLNEQKFITVIEMIQKLLYSITQEELKQFYNYNFLIQIALTLIQQISLIKTKMFKLSTIEQQQQSTIKHTQIITLLNNILYNLIKKILSPIKQKYSQISSRKSLQQEQNQLKPLQQQPQQVTKQFPLSNLSYPILHSYYEYFEIQNKAKNNTHLKHIPMPSHTDSKHNYSSPLYSLFDLKISTVKQGEINFVFDIIIPKLTSHFWLLYGESLSKKQDSQKMEIQKKVLLKDIVEKYLNKSTIKIVYVFQILLDFMFSDINSLVDKVVIKDVNKQEITSQQQKENNNELLQRVQRTLQEMLQLYNMLGIESIFEPQLKQESLMNDKISLLKMVTYLISGFLLDKIKQFQQKLQQRKQINQLQQRNNINQLNQQVKSVQEQRMLDIFNKTYTKLWVNIFEFLYFFINKHQLQQKKLTQINSYEQLLRIKDPKCKLSMFYMDFIRFSLLDRKSNQIITFQQLKQIYLTHHHKRGDNNNQLQKLVTKIINRQQFKQSITLNNQIPLILSKLSNINLHSLQQKPQKPFKNINSYIDIIASQTKIRSNKSITSINSQKNIQQNKLYTNIQSLSLNLDNKNHFYSNNSNKVDIEKILQKQNILEEDMRAVYFFNQELQVRKFHKIWQKLWKKMRLYHHPYGLWMAMRTDSHHYEYKHNPQQIKNFTYKISKYSSSSGLKPILQARIIQPWHIIKTKLLQNKQQIAYLSDMIQSAVESSISKKSSDSNQNGQKMNMLNIWNYMWKIPAYYMGKSSSSKSKSRVFNVVWIKGNIKAQGRVSLNNNDQIQFWFNGIRQQDSHLTFQKFTLPFNKQLFKKWPLIMIKKISQRRYLMKYHALEFQFIDSLFVLLHFVDCDQKQFLQLIENIRQERIIALGSKIKANSIEIFQPGWYCAAFDWNQLSLLTEKWRLNQISNLSYLIKLNILASRSGLDLSQYPVLPWIASITNDKQPILRDLTKTLGALGSQERVQSLKQKFNSKDPFNPVPAFHYGTHYSSPGVVFNFLIRVSPFTQYLKSLQGGRFDLPDRLFSSLISSWKSAYTQISDVRELVPEFYYLPQMLINLQEHNFGLTQSLQRINHVDLPLWTVNNPYYFVIQFRQMLESCEASQRINEWIDLIFGYKQRGQQAQKSMNLYYYLTYEEYNDFDDQQDDVYKKSCQAQIVHFGQVPPQLFQKPHPKRIQLRKQLMQIKLINKYLLMNKLNQPPAGIHLQQEKKSLSIIKRNTIEHYSLQKNPISLLKANKFNLQRSSSELFYLWRKDTAKTIFFNKHPYFISIGYVNHQLRVYNKVHGKLEKQEILESKINHVLLNEEENLIIVGCEDGLLTIYQIEYQSNGSKIFLEKVHQQIFPHSINHISERDGWTLVSFGSHCAVYKISRSLHYLSTNNQHYKPCLEFIRSFKNPLKILSAYIIISPLYALILIDNAGIKCYSINGQFMKSLSCNPKSELFILRDNEMNEFVYFLQDERIVVMSTPDLRSVSQMQVGVKCLGLWSDGLLVFDEWIGKVGW